MMLRLFYLMLTGFVLFMWSGNYEVMMRNDVATLSFVGLHLFFGGAAAVCLFGVITGGDAV